MKITENEIEVLLPIVQAKTPINDYENIILQRLEDNLNKELEVIRGAG